SPTGTDPSTMAPLGVASDSDSQSQSRLTWAIFSSDSSLSSVELAEAVAQAAFDAELAAAEASVDPAASLSALQLRTIRALRQPQPRLRPHTHSESEFAEDDSSVRRDRKRKSDSELYSSRRRGGQLRRETNVSDSDS